jgi:hypothetical protein
MDHRGKREFQVRTALLITWALLGVLVGGGEVARGATTPFLDDPPSGAQAAAPASTLEVEPIFRYWRASLSGNMTITAGGHPGSGSRIDVSSDLDLGTTNAFEGGARVSIGRHELAVRYDPSSFQGDATLNRPFVYHGTTYPAGERVSSDVSLDFVIPEYGYRLWSAAVADLRSGIRGYIWTIDSELKGTGPGGVLDQSRGFTHALPAGFFALEGAWGDLRVGGTMAGGLLASDRYVADFEAGVGYNLLGGRAEVDVGYRWLRFDFHETTNVGALTESGLLVSLSARFSP